MTAPPPSGTMTARQVLSFLIATRRGLTFALVVVSLIAGLAEALTISLVVKAVGETMAGSTGGSELGPFTVSITAMLVAAALAVLVRLVSSAYAAHLGARLSACIRQDLRNRLVRAYAGADWSVQVRDRSGEFAEVTTAQVQEAGAIVLGGTQAVVAGSTLISLLVTSAVISPLATLILLVLGFVVFGVARPLTKRAYRSIQHSVQAHGDVASDIDSMCACTEEMHVYGVADHFCRRISDSVAASEEAFYRGQFHGRLASALFQSATLVIIVAGAIALALAAPGRDVSTLGAVVILLMRGAGLAQQIQNFTALLNTQKPYVERVAREAQRYESSWRTGEERIAGSHGSHPVVLRDASFTYPGAPAPALEPTSLTIGPTGALGITGPSGAGKSTLVQLLLGLRRPDRGSVSYGGVQIADLSPRGRSSVIALVGQTPKLLPGTIRENIAFFRDVPEEAIRRAAARAAVLDDIEALPEGFDTIVGQRVDPVSGGQRQRICIARALAAQPAILVLDEPTSSLDATSESTVVGTLAELARSLAVVIVSHRDAPLSICERVLRIRDGRVEPDVAHP